jgi:hypothetical protein
MGPVTFAGDAVEDDLPIPGKWFDPFESVFARIRPIVLELR